MKSYKISRLAFACLVLCSLFSYLGCSRTVPPKPFYERVGWKASDYFEDPQVVLLCEAIGQNNVTEMERLIKAGVDVNTVGKLGMTPLLWSFPDRKIERFECLLRHGANPNLIFQSDFGTGREPFHPYPEQRTEKALGAFSDSGCHAGESVLHLACKSPVAEYFSLVLRHGGDPNLVDTNTGVDPLTLVLDRHVPDRKQ